LDLPFFSQLLDLDLLVVLFHLNQVLLEILEHILLVEVILQGFIRPHFLFIKLLEPLVQYLVPSYCGVLELLLPLLQGVISHQPPTIVQMLSPFKVFLEFVEFFYLWGQLLNFDLLGNGVLDFTPLNLQHSLLL